MLLLILLSQISVFRLFDQIQGCLKHPDLRNSLKAEKDLYPWNSSMSPEQKRLC